jgi:phosphomevalonate kinase
VLICCERKVLLAGGWFVLREKYRWLVVDKPNEQADGVE